MELRDAFEQAFEELGINLADDTGSAIPPPTVEGPEDDAAEDGPETPEEPGEDPVAESDGDESGEAETDGPQLTVTEDALLVLPDGTTVPAKDAILFQKDYTKKTQQVAEERKTLESEREEFEEIRGKVAEAYEQMRGWYEEKVQNRSGWVEEIVSEADDPTATLARAIYQLAQAGRLDQTFVKAFGLDDGELAQVARQASEKSEVAELRRKVEDRERAEQEQDAIRRQAAAYQSQWAEIKSNHGLAFAEQGDEYEAKRELLDFALKHNLAHSLVDAYDLMLVRTGRAVSQPEKPKVADPVISEKKRASRAVTPKSAVGSAPVAPRPKSVRDAALMSIEEMLVGN